MRLEVGQRGIAELSLERGETVRVYPGTVITLDGPGSSLELDSGKVWCLVELAAVPFVVKTDLAEARVVGTSFVVERAPSGETNVRVMKGQVQVKKLERKEKLLVKSGWKTRVARDKPLGPPQRYGPGTDRSEWDRAVDELWRDIKRAFRKAKEFFEDD